MTWLLRVYDFFAAHRRYLWCGVCAVLVPLLILAVILRYNEDIMDFLPVTPEEREQLENGMQQSATRLVLIAEGDDEQRRTEAIEACAERIPDLETEIDINEQLASLYALMPYLIADSTYAQFDSLFTPAAVRAALQRDRLILSTPGTGTFAYAIQSDPLGLVDLSEIRASFSPEETYAFYESPYGSTETRHNAVLMDSLTAVANEVASDFPDLHIRWIGAPAIAVENARRIKTDSLLCIVLSLVLIIALLLYAFPRRRDIWLILLAVSCGWLFGMAVLRLVTPAVSVVVLGIGSVLIGIAVNYPLHLLVHQRYTTSVRQTLSEVLSPLVIGNITTVGAFLALIPLQATALRHLGIFAAAMLVGTILFCVFIMPHLMSATPTPVREIKLPVLADQRMKNAGQWTIVAITLLLGLFLLLPPFSAHRSPLFDSDLSHINYMTPQQRADIAYFDSVANPQHVVESNRYKADVWQAYWQTHSADSVIACVQNEAAAVGFTPDAFAPFYEKLSDFNYQVAIINYSDIAKRLSDDFDYIGLCCSLIVFIFLWLSFRNIWLAIIAFVPMALSWIWILAIMHIMGLQFNIVNIILATFIFGQGDDYTIFIVEGLLYEHRTGKPILSQYMQSIFLSALIMLIGIGILVLAVHPAMHSLGVITLIGMFIVLLMALTVPPVLFRLYTRLSPRAFD